MSKPTKSCFHITVLETRENNTPERSGEENGSIPNNFTHIHNREKSKLQIFMISGFFEKSLEKFTKWFFVKSIFWKALFIYVKSIFQKATFERLKSDSSRHFSFHSKSDFFWSLIKTTAFKQLWLNCRTTYYNFLGKSQFFKKWIFHTFCQVKFFKVNFF